MRRGKGFGWLFCPHRCVLPWRVGQNSGSGSRLYATKQSQDVVIEVSRTRNIGIIAHIDAVGCCYLRKMCILLIIPQGKTTTTERMLYYSGHTRRIGSMYPLDPDSCYLLALNDNHQTIFVHAMH